ncbi:hypothetical protein Vi05172_g1859 [Venturia inaequalis]|nr:hypothetical protein Vi05172_g1859 [Venturia inaequalis]
MPPEEGKTTDKPIGSDSMRTMRHSEHAPRNEQQATRQPTEGKESVHTSVPDKRRQRKSATRSRRRGSK